MNKKNTSLIILVIAIISIILLGIPFNTKSENYELSTVEDCKALIPSVKAYANLEEEIGPVLLKNIFLATENITSEEDIPNYCLWRYIGVDEEDITIEHIFGLLEATNIMISITAFEDTDRLSEFFDATIQSYEANQEATLTKLGTSFYSVKAANVYPSTNKIINGHVITKKKGNLLINLQQMFSEESQAPITEANAIALVDSI